MKVNEPIHWEEIVAQASSAFAVAKDEADLENQKAHFLGKQSLIFAALSNLPALDIEQRRREGVTVNAAKRAIEQALQRRREDLAAQRLTSRLQQQSIDVTLPGRGIGCGSLHPVLLTWERVEAIFNSIGFAVAQGPEIETDWYNFTALNNPADHPARSMQDTFYLHALDREQKKPLMLRTHTSAMQIRYAQAHQPPLKVIVPGRVYRVDQDATHIPMFHQVEALWVDKGIGFADLKGVYFDFLHTFFGDQKIQIRFRPSYFPFTEPSAEIDLRFTHGPRAGTWLEVAGAGQVHPKVIENMNLDSEEYTGFAFGMGLDRLAMLQYGVGDIRHFLEADLSFLAQFESRIFS